MALTGWRGRPEPLPGQPPLRAFTLGLLTGTVYFAGTIYWTGTVIIAFGDVNPIARDGRHDLLSAYLALYPAVASLVTSRLIARLGAAGLFIAPMAWVATEYLRGYFLTGFPWVPLGNSQVTVLPVAQLASVLGVYGLSALVAYVNATLAYSLVTSGTRRVRRRRECGRCACRCRRVGRLAHRATARSPERGRRYASGSSRATSRRRTSGILRRRDASSRPTSR